jgi:predicted alpha/beta superfamily hydrolase
MAKARNAAAFYVAGNETRYAIYIDKPKAAHHPGEPWIPVIGLDGDDQFSELCKARKVAEKKVRLPPLLLVGVGYGAGYGKPENKRMRDYTPVPMSEEPESGGADAFQQFLIGTLWPELERRYPLHPRIRGISGHSLGGLFALHAVFGPTRFFNRALASAPSIWWAERAILNTLEACQKPGENVSAALFACIGLKDGKSMIADLGLMESQLASRPVRKLRVNFARFPGRTHFSVIPVGFRTGLAMLFGSIEPPRAVPVRAVELAPPLKGGRF